MQAHEFVLKGDRIRLTRNAVLTALAEVAPAPVARWAIEAHGRLYPVKQAFAIATGRTGFTSDTARRVFRQLGFSIVDVRQDLPGEQDEAQAAVERVAPLIPSDVRVLGLLAALDYARSHPDMLLADVLSAADTIAEWLSR